MALILVHELGHLLAAKYYGWNTDKIYIYPLGGITKFNESINRSLKEEFIIVIMGPVFQLIFFFILTSFGIKDLYLFNFLLLGFNLLPIYPLDGGKILNIILAYFFSYRRSFLATITFSFLVYFLIVIIICSSYKSLFFVIVIFSLLFKIIEEFKKRNYYFNKFLLERYLYKFRFPKIKYIKDIKKMYRNRSHIFILDNTFVTEGEMLKKYFARKLPK